MHLHNQKSWKELVSPSNLAMAALVGFLFAGQVTDWKILGRKKANTHVKFGTPESSRAWAQHSRHANAGFLRDSTVQRLTKADPKSEVADRRPANHEAQTNPGELE